MAIDYNALDSANYTFPTKKIPVPELKAFFCEDEKPEWEIKGLQGHELAIVNEAVEVLNKTRIIMKAIASGTNKSLQKGMEEFVNKDGETTPEDLARRFKMLELASIPKCPENICVKLAAAKPTTFYKITNEIIRMTGEGASLGE